MKVSVRREWDAFDRLPAALRAALHETNLDWSAVEARADLQRLVRLRFDLPDACTIIIGLYEKADRDEVERFQYQWPSRLGKYPALAAQSTFQRYDRSSGVRRLTTDDCRGAA